MLEKLKIIKAVLIGIVARNSLMTGALCEEERILKRYSNERAYKKERNKALESLVLIERDLKTNIQKYRESNERVKNWKDYEIIFLLVFVGNLFTNTYRSFSDSQEIRMMTGDHMEDYLPLHESIKVEGGNLNKLFKVEYGRCYYNYELQKDVTLDTIIEFAIK
jgi:hypothetical protein